MNVKTYTITAGQTEPLVTDAMIDAFIRASDSNGYGAQKGSYLWEMTERGLKAALSLYPYFQSR